MNNKKQIFLGIFLAMVVIGAILYWNSNRNIEPMAFVAESKSAGVSFAEGQEILEMLEILQSTRLNLEFFSSPVFKGLVDYSVELIPEPIGRDNPFLPFEDVDLDGSMSVI